MQECSVIHANYSVSCDDERIIGKEVSLKKMDFIKGSLYICMLCTLRYVTSEALYNHFYFAN